jgi:hypothetical protein
VATTRLPTTSSFSPTGAASAARIPSAANSRAVSHLLHEVGSDARRGDQVEHLGILGIDQPQADRLVAEQLLGAGGDRREDLSEIAAADDRALDLREALEQPLAFGERPDQAGVLGALALAQLAQAPLRIDDPLQADRERQHPRHPVREVALLGGEDEIVVAGEHERLEPLVSDRRAHRLALADPGDLEPVGIAVAHPFDRLERDLVDAEAGGGDDAVRADDHADLRLERLGRALDRVADGRRLVVGGR